MDETESTNGYHREWSNTTVASQKQTENDGDKNEHIQNRLNIFWEDYRIENKSHGHNDIERIWSS